MRAGQSAGGRQLVAVLVAINADRQTPLQPPSAGSVNCCASQANYPGLASVGGVGSSSRGNHAKSLATLARRFARGCASESELDNLVLLAGAAEQPWQGRHAAGRACSIKAYCRTAREERLALLWWQARERSRLRRFSGELSRAFAVPALMNLAQLRWQTRWQAGWMP